MKTDKSRMQEFLYGFAKGADIDLSQAQEQWAGHSAQLSDDKRRLIESQGEDSGFSEGQAFAKLYPPKPSIREASIELGSINAGDSLLTLHRIHSANDRGWGIGLEWIETNGDPVTENEEGFRDLRDQITGDDEPSELLHAGVEISLERLENVTDVKVEAPL